MGQCEEWTSKKRPDPPGQAGSMGRPYRLVAKSQLEQTSGAGLGGGQETSMKCWDGEERRARGK